MALLPQDRQSQVMLLITIGMVGLGYAFWNYWAKPTGQEIEATQTEVASMEAVIAQAKADLASGTVEDLRRKVEEYTALRGVTIGRIEPQAVEPGPPFDTYRYRLEIIGHYDQLGEFLSDIASLPRIIVPQDVVLKAAAGQAQKLLGDTLGALLEAQFGIRTFVKAAAPPPPPAKKGGAGGGP